MKKLFKPLANVGDDSIVHIIHNEQDRLETIADYGYEDLVPLTADDMWKFMPWQDMDSTPINEPMLIIANGQVQIGIFALNADGELHLFNNNEVLAYTQDCDKWLPLPKADKLLMSR